MNKSKIFSPSDIEVGESVGGSGSASSQAPSVQRKMNRWFKQHPKIKVVAMSAVEVQGELVITIIYTED